MISKKLIVIFGVIVAVAAFYFLRGGEPSGGGAPHGGGMTPNVTVVTVKELPVQLSETLPGRTSAYKVAEIRPQVSGIIIERSFKEGENVDEGQQLYQIDPASYEAAYQSAKAALKRVQANVKSVKARSERYAELVEIDAISKQEYDDIKASLAQAEADIAVAEADVVQAKINLDYTKVYSPISGRIGKSSVTEGALVTANQTSVLTKVTQLDPIYVDLTQSSIELIGLRRQIGEVGELPVVLKFQDGLPYEHEGALQFSDITVDETTGSVQLRALFPNPERILLPGLFVHATLKLGEQSALLVPQRAATRDQQGNLNVWVVGDDNKVNPQAVTALRAYGDQWVINSGVEVGQKVVLEGFQKIGPGAEVIAVEQTPSTEAEAKVE